MHQPGRSGTRWYRNWRLLSLLAMLALAVPSIWYVVYSIHVMQDEEDTAQDLAVIAQSKAREIENWLVERRGDAQILARGSGFVERVTALVENKAEDERSRIVDRLTALRSTFGYQSIELFDRYGTPVVTVGEPPELPEGRPRLIREAIATPETRMGDLHLDSAGRARLNFSVGLFRGTEPVGVVVLHVDPQKFLYPLVKAWPTASRSGETLLVRKDGDSVLYLNALRHQKGAELRLHVSIANEHLPAAAALLTSRAGTLSGKDYRGIPVQSAWQPVTGTPWMLLAKVDQAEVRVAARHTAHWAAAIASITLLLVGIAMMRLSQQQKVARDLALEAQSSRLQAHFYDLPFIGMAVVSPVTGKWLQANAKLCEMLGYSLEELRAKTFLECTHPDDITASSEAFDSVMRGEKEGYLIEKRYLRKDGTPVQVRLDSRVIRDPGGAPLSLVSTLEDLSLRREAEERYRKLARLYATLSRCNSAIIQATTENGLLNEICRIAVESGGMRMAWVGMVTPGTTEILPVASFGSGTDYLTDLRVSIDEDEMTGRGPTGTAAREDQPIWCPDFLNDPRTVPWHAQGVRFGWRGSAALPLHSNGKVIGCLMLYVDTPHAFDAETQGLLTEIAMNTGYGLDTLAFAAERLAASTKLAESEERYLTQLKSALMRTVEVATRISEMRDPYTAGHEKRVALIATGIAAEFGLDEQRIEGLRVAGYLHDIGKITMPSEIQSKPGRLTAAEYELVKGHSQSGYDVLKDVDFPWPVADIVLQHHERIDGSGYPKGLKGDAILPEAKILAVADVVEAMSSHRPYRAARSLDLALGEIERGRGTLYDNQVVDACLKLFRETGFRLPDARDTGT